MALVNDTTQQTLDRILATVEKSHRKGWVEVASAIILSLATMSSAWCAYQSKLWGETQGSRDGDAASETKKASENRLLAGEIRAVESTLFVKIVEAKNDGKEPLARFLTSRLFPHTQAALAAWWDMDPVKNADAPRSPFLMPQYKQPQMEEAKQQEEHAMELHQAAGVAGRNSDTFVLLTVLFASVLFFGGISGTFDHRVLRRVVLVIALLLFLVTFTALVKMPVEWS